MSNLIRIAQDYRSLGLSVVPVLSTKRPPGYWRKYQQTIMSDREIRYAFSQSQIYGIAVVCGSISGNFEGFDADCKYDLSGNLMERLYNSIEISTPQLLPRLVIASSRNAGVHFYYRCPEVGRNQILARRPSTPQELITHPDKPGKTLLETRSNGGIIIVPPTTGYLFLQKDMRDLPTIDPAERRLLFETARTFNLCKVQSITYGKTNQPSNEPPELSPFYAYNKTDEVIECLQKHGWIRVRTVGPRTYFRRPGDTDKDTSGDFHHELRKFKVFTPNSQHFMQDVPYHPYAVFAILECNGDFHLAAKKLLAAGYGIAYKDRR